MSARREPDEPGGLRHALARLLPGPGLMPPMWLDPVLAFVERVDRHRRHIRPIRADGILAIELARYGGPPVVLRDGTAVVSGDRIVLLHFRNDRIRAGAQPGWQVRLWPEAREDFRALASWWASQPPDERPVALHSATIHGALARRMGCEIRPRPPSARRRLDEWFMSWLLAYWGRAGRGRVADHRAHLVSVDVWLSAEALLGRWQGQGRSDEAGPAA